MLEGRRILIAEDEQLIALDLEASIRENHGIPLGPVGTVAEAEAILLSEWPDGAILDLRLQGGSGTEFAQRLRSQGVVVVIHSGQVETALPSGWPESLIVAKPALPEAVISALAAALTRKVI